MSDDVNKSAVEFLIKHVNPVYLNAYNTLAMLEYPIDDFESLEKQLAKNKSEDSQNLISLLLEPTDMPLTSPQGGMEKFHTHLLGYLDRGRVIDDRREIPDIPSGTPLLPRSWMLWL